MKLSLADVRVAILAADGVDHVALTTPRAALEAAGARTILVAPADGAAGAAGHVTTSRGDAPGTAFAVDLALADARAEDFDALLVPGGDAGARALSADPAAIAFVRAFDAQDKPIAAICHGPWLLAAADIARGRRIAAWPTLEKALRDAGAVWVDSQVAIDGRILTCRTARDLASFMRPTIARFATPLAGASALAVH